MKHNFTLSSSILISIIFVAFSLYFSITNATNIIPKTCKKISNIDSDVKYNFCIWAFGRKNPNAINTIEQLGYTSFELAISKGMSTKSKIENILKDPQLDPRKIRVLKLFVEQYSDALVDLKGGLKALELKDYLEANNRASSATISALTCKNDSKAKRRIPAFVGENDDFFQLNSISIFITNMLFEMDGRRSLDEKR
ncbi:putative invertase inhibitor [Amaranthus tricolor]|uniref:putative invertase inhibitor n=1 Tax=Amaranthus tricolor TaxID=29722 RepID=UPI00258E0FA1|nr:putative invertase inhibitor [Amaranthus tricolor]